jgi:hypothetical protein
MISALDAEARLTSFGVIAPTPGRGLREADFAAREARSANATLRPHLAIGLDDEGLSVFEPPDAGIATNDSSETRGPEVEDIRVSRRLTLLFEAASRATRSSETTMSVSPHCRDIRERPTHLHGNDGPAFF